MSQPPSQGAPETLEGRKEFSVPVEIFFARAEVVAWISEPGGVKLRFANGRLERSVTLGLRFLFDFLADELLNDPVRALCNLVRPRPRFRRD